MSRIKINLASGTVIDKPLVTCFKGSNGDYLVLDNETNGQMGYPIICISKFNGTSVDKINDQAEWSAVKDNLKTIIAGTALPYLSVPENLTGPDDFFTQLTLPVASFDLLKSVYSPSAPAAPTTPETAPVSGAPGVVSPEPASPVAEPTVIAMPEQPIAAPEVALDAPIAPVMPEMPAAPITEPTAVVATTVISPVMPEQPAVTEPANPAPVIDIAPAVTSPVMDPVVPPVVDTPIATPTPSVDTSTNTDVTAIKEAFMQSCENMFDALIKKFENK